MDRAAAREEHHLSFRFDDSWMIPLEPGQAVDRGWPERTWADRRPVAVTWHWTATWTLERCHQLIGGAEAENRGRASAHYAVGRSFEEGVARYVSLENRSWHAGFRQKLRFDGRPMTRQEEKGARTSIGVETVNIGYARTEPDEPAVVADPDWILADTVDGGRRLVVQPWSDEQIEMMIAVGREIVQRWPEIGPRHHHGHHDLCPGYKVDVAGFPFARVLRGIYPNENIPDVWSGTWTARGRRRALAELGFVSWNAYDEDRWTRADHLTLRRAQRALGLHVDGLWTTAVAWAVHDARA